jgi:predicted transcriptional regulator
MASKAYTISMPEEIMELIDSVAKRTHRSRSETLRQMARHYITCQDRDKVDIPAALFEAAAPFREAAALVGEEVYNEIIGSAIKEVRDAKSGAGHQCAAKGVGKPAEREREGTAAVR